MVRNVLIKRVVIIFGKCEVIIILWFILFELKWNNVFYIVLVLIFFVLYKIESIIVNKMSMGVIYNIVIGIVFVFCILFNVFYLLYYLDKFFMVFFKNVVLF